MAIDDIQSFSDNKWKPNISPIVPSEALNTEVEQANLDHVLLNQEQSSPTNMFPELSSTQHRNTEAQFNGFSESEFEK